MEILTNNGQINRIARGIYARLKVDKYLVIQALKSKGQENLSEQDKQKIIEYLRQEESYRLKHDMNLAPEWHE